METAVRKATRLDYQAPKQKHLNTLNAFAMQQPANVADMIDLLERRLRENSWIVTFKVLIILHTLMREGHDDRVITLLESRPSAMDTSRLREKASGTAHVQNTYLYGAYLQHKVHAFRQLKMDYVKATLSSKVGRLRHLSVAKGLLTETAAVQKQIHALLQCNFQFDGANNDISLYAFRLLVEEMLVLFRAVNEGVVNILEHYFAMSKPDARQSLEVYKRFAHQTESVVAFLQRAKQLEHELQISIPVTRHAPLSLATALEEYLDSASNAPPTPPDQNQQAASALATSQPTSNATQQPAIASSQQQQQQQQPKELLDFFASLETEHTTIFTTATTAVQPAFQPATSGSYNPFLTNTTTVVSNATGFSSFLAPPQPATQIPQFPNALAPVPSLSSSMTTNNSNPFRSNTLPGTPQQSISTPAYTNVAVQNTLQNGFQTSMASASSPSMMFTSQPSQPVLSSNPFAVSGPSVQQPQSISSSNPFSTQQQQQQQHQQLPSAWGSSSMF